MHEPMIVVEDLHKIFTLHNQGGVQLPVLRHLNMTVYGGEVVVLQGPSGSGKSSVLRSLYANYKSQAGRVLIRHRGSLIDITSAGLREVMEIRRYSLGYVSQFLRAVPRVAAIDVVSEPLRLQGVHAGEARERAAQLLARLKVRQQLWHLAPSTFSGGEQQRVNIAHGFIAEYPILLLDEPTAALDASNRAVVVELIEEARERGTAIVGIFHDDGVRERVASRLYKLHAEEPQATEAKLQDGRYA